jgi:hypothetical protein
MSERTGLGVVDIAILEALDTSQYLRCSRALASVEERIGLAPGYAYQVLVDLARPWTMPINLVHGQGNFGSRGNDPPANFRYTQARISRAGRVRAGKRVSAPPLLRQPQLFARVLHSTGYALTPPETQHCQSNALACLGLGFAVTLASPNTPPRPPGVLAGLAECVRVRRRAADK